MREVVHHYLYNDTSFEVFGSDHFWGLTISVLLIVIIPWISVRYLNRKSQNNLGMIIGYIVMLNYPAWVMLEIIAGSFDVSLLNSTGYGKTSFSYIRNIIFLGPERLPAGSHHSGHFFRFPPFSLFQVLGWAQRNHSCPYLCCSCV